MAHFAAWVASIDTLRVDGRKLNMTVEADSPVVRVALRQTGFEVERAEQAQLLGVVSVRVLARYDYMRRLSDSEREQVDVGEAVVDKTLSNQAFVFEMCDALPLDDPPPLQQYSDRNFRGLTVTLEQGQAERELARVDLPAWLHDREPPQVALRMPVQHAVLLVEKKRSRLILPDVPSRGSSALVIGWRQLGVPPEMVPPAAADLPDAGGDGFV